MSDGYIARMVRKIFNSSNTWNQPQNFAGGIVGGLTAGSGTVYHVDPTSGSSGATGKTWGTALAGIDEAYAKCADGAGDIILVQSRGSSSSATTTYLDETLTWAKSGITVVGLCAPTLFSRARIANTGTVTDIAKLVSITGDNNAFYNIDVFQGGSDAAALGCVEVTGNRNYFENCHFMGGGHATPAAETGCYSILCNEAEEARFVGCTFGTDTIIAAAANAPIRFDGGAMRCEFFDCRVLSYSDTAGHGAIITADAAAVLRDILFKGCVFTNFSPNSPSALTVAIIGTAPTSGIIAIANCQAFGWAAWAVANDAYFIANGAADNDAAGIGVVQA